MPRLCYDKWKRDEWRRSGVLAFSEVESILTWIGTTEGGKGTMYEGFSYKLSL
ncbi:hypothetical protein SLEP1_g56084 [Rubroshorea leprosula]|uniref:Uncharacterized protein n=1 Tax=Rubroshorea leprosula TaxID=152421 RepID=A0AAV5MJZ1_9ROSI|nr:hypothetical protein SLEP1_g56084 [Rubroshorea leprosula]